MPYKILEGERVIMEKKKKNIVFGKYTNTQQRIALKSSCRDITGGPVVKNQPPNERNMDGFDPWFGKTPHAAERLSPCTPSTEPLLESPQATTTEPTCCNY